MKKTYAVWQVLKTSEQEQECIDYRNTLPEEEKKKTFIMRLFLKFDASEPSYTVYKILIENSNSKEECIKYRDSQKERRNIVIVEKVKDTRPDSYL